MSSSTRRFLLWLSAPVVAFAVVGGFLSRALAGQDVYEDLKIFDDVVGLIDSSYVEPADIDRVMQGAMLGLADSLDPDSAYLSAEQVEQVESGAAPPKGDVGIDLTRQYYLRILATRDGSPAEKAGLRTGDYVRVIDGRATRDLSVFDGMQALRGAPGTTVRLTILRGSAVDPHEVELVREAMPPRDVSARIPASGVGYVRIAAIGPETASRVKTQVSDLAGRGATSLIVDVRGTSGGSYDGAIALARLFVGSGTITRRESKGRGSTTVEAQPGDGSIALPTRVLVDAGTTAGAEVFVAALAGNHRAETVGEHTIGRAGQQTLVKLPDGSGLWLTTTRYLMPDGSPLHEHGIEPTVQVSQPPVEFGQAPPAGDPVLEKALELATAAKAAA